MVIFIAIVTVGNHGNSMVKKAMFDITVVVYQARMCVLSDVYLKQ